MLRTIPFALMVAALVLIASPVAAQTPDGETPAVETVCEPLRNATAGLYGLCIAYCEAHDAELDPVTLEPPDVPAANEKVLENYNRRKTATDPDMPCLKTPCPCFDAADLADLDLSVCTIQSDQNVFVRGSICGARFADHAQVRAVAGHLSCSLRDVDSTTCQLVIGTSQNTTVDEFIVCRDLLAAEIARRGLTCP